MSLKKDIRRFDRGGLDKPTRLENGWMRVDAFIARTGLLEYARADGSKWVEFRPADEAFRADVLESFASVPLTNDHPPEGFLSAENTKLYQVGTVETPRQDGDKVRARLLVTDSDAIAAIGKGKAELSCGYLCDLDLTPGEHEGQHYDAIQRNVRGNHVALVKAGRAGPEVRLRADHAAEFAPFPEVKDNPRMLKIRIDGVDYEVPEVAAQAFAKHEKAQGETIAEVTANAEKTKARADAAEAEVAKLKAELTSAPEKIRAEISARMDLEAKASAVLGETKFDGMTAAQIHAAVAEKVTGLKLDGKSESYLAAAFDLALQRHTDEGLTLPVTKPIRADGGGNVAEAARLKFQEASRNAYKTTKKES